MATTTDHDPPCWTPNDVAEFLGVSVSTIYCWRYQGEGPPGYRVGRHVRYRPSDVEAWLESRRDSWS